MRKQGNWRGGDGFVRCLGLALILAAAGDALAANRKPVAQAGADFVASPGESVVLDAGASHDPDGSMRSHLWRQTSGMRVRLSGASTAHAVFTAPALGRKSRVTLNFRLKVTDNHGASASDSVAVTVAPLPSCVPPTMLIGRSCVTPAPVCVAPNVLRDGVCKAVHTPVIFCPEQEILQNGVCAPRPADYPFNDTAMTGCADGAVGGLGCPLDALPGQDAEFGRDARHPDDADGHAGFSFTKRDGTGADLPVSATGWTCVRDRVTGLLWDAHATGLYTNYSASYDPAGQLGAAGDAAGRVARANAERLCGVRDWRLPTADELQGIVDFSIAYPGPTVDARFFPDTQPVAHWTATDHARLASNAWVVYFDDGRVYEDDRDRRYAVRLVSGAPRPATLVVSEDGREVVDAASGLVWRRCLEGMAWTGTGCAGSPSYFMWYDTLSHARNEAGLSGKPWRVPNVKELTRILDWRRGDLALDPAFFPGASNDQYWASTHYGLDAFYGWVAQSYYGAVFFTYLEHLGVLLLVRDL